MKRKTAVVVEGTFCGRFSGPIEEGALIRFWLWLRRGPEDTGAGAALLLAPLEKVKQ